MSSKEIIFSGIAMLVSLLVTAFSTGLLIPKLKAHQFEQAIRDFGPQSHLKKQGTPSMGGIAMILGIVVSTIVVSLIFFKRVSVKILVALLVMLLYAAIGFMDDYKKAIEKKSDGLSAKMKLLLQFLACVVFAIYCYKFNFGEATGFGYLHHVWIPFYGAVDFGIWYIPWVIFVMIAFTNSVNLTDGLDGLASTVTAVVSFFMIIASLFSVMYGFSLAYGAVMGACIGFLLYNHYPAKIFMGDTGSMALGGIIASLAIMMHMEIFLAIAGLIYVCESLSVIIQVAYFKLTHGKRIFRMSPIHHHYELGGLKETQIVFRFSLFTVVCCIIMLLGIR